MYKYATLALLMGLLGAPSAEAVQVQGLLGMGIEFGGEKLLTLQYSDGSTSSLQSGRGLMLTAGAILQAFEQGDHSLEVQGSVGLKYGTVKEASNQSVSFTRFPLELLGFYHYAPARLRLGGGMAYHLSPSISADGELSNAEVDMNNALGAIIQADYALSAQLLLGVRYTLMKYEITASGATSDIDANCFGINLSFVFGG